MAMLPTADAPVRNFAASIQLQHRINSKDKETDLPENGKKKNKKEHGLASEILGILKKGGCAISSGQVNG